MPSLADKKHELDTLIDGFLVPIFQQEGPNGRMLNGLGPDDYQRCVEGYACPDCLARYRTYLATCPVCGWTRNVQNDVERPPELWVRHLEDRANPKVGVRMPTQARIEAALRDIHEDPEIEQIPLSKLRNTRKRP
jgi:hypothetical protein